jgi:transcriptional regulator with XRE-family HTH domain
VSTKNPALERFGREVRKRRKAKSLTIEQLAELAGISANYLGAVERGTVNPSVSTIQALAKGLGVAPGELIGEVAELSTIGRELAELFDLLSHEMKRILLLLLRAAVRPRGK